MMERANLFIMLPHVASPVSTPFYRKCYQTVNSQSVKAIAVSLTATERFFDYEDYDTFYDGLELSEIIKLLLLL